MTIARVYKFEPADLVLDRIYIGPEGATFDEDYLRSANIVKVLTVAAHSDHLTHFDGIEYKQIDVDDSPTEDLVSHFDAAFEFISSVNLAVRSQNDELKRECDFRH